MSDIRKLLESLDKLDEVKNPYSGADAEKFDSLSPEDQAWLTKGGGKPDINDPYIMARAPNKGVPVKDKAADTTNKGPGDFTSNGVPVDDLTTRTTAKTTSKSTWKNPNVKGGGEPSRWQTQLSKTGISDGSITLKSTNKTYSYSNQKDIRDVRKEYGRLITRYQKLIQKMNESAPVSLRGYLKEYAIEDLLYEALSTAEQDELRTIYQDLMAIANWKVKDSRGASIPAIGEFNVKDIQAKLKNAPDFVKQAKVPKSAKVPKAAYDPADDDAANMVTPDDVGKIPRKASGTLRDFMSSGEGGLANNPEEVDAIKEMQEILNDFGFNVGEPDGKYGAMTKKAVMNFQKFIGAGRDGDAGPETIKELLDLNELRFGNDKTFGDFRRLMKRMEKLIGKAGPATEESKDMSSMRNLIESVSRLNEELSDADAKELQAIVGELSDVYGDPSWQASLPRATAKRFASNYKAAQGALKDLGLNAKKPEANVDVGEPKAEPPSEEPTSKEEPASPVDAIKDIQNKIQNAVSGIGTNDEQLLAALNQLKGQADYDALIKSNPEIEKILKGQDSTFGVPELTFSDREKVNKILKNKGIDITSKKGPEAEPTTAPTKVSMGSTAKELSDALHGFLGTEDEDAVADIFKNLKSWDDFVKLEKEYKKSNNVSLIQDLQSELSSGEYKEIVDSNLRRLEVKQKMKNASDPAEKLKIAAELGDELKNYLTPREIQDLQSLLSTATNKNPTTNSNNDAGMMSGVKDLIGGGN